MDGQNFQNEQNTANESVQTTDNYQDYTANVTPVQAVVEQPKQTNALAIVSLVLGIISIVFGCCGSWIGILLAIGGIVCSVLSKKQGKTGLATAGLICSIVAIVIAIVVIILAVIGVAALAELEEMTYSYY